LFSVQSAIWVWIKIKELGDYKFKSIFSINHPIIGVFNFDLYPYFPASPLPFQLSSPASGTGGAQGVSDQCQLIAVALLQNLQENTPQRDVYHR
jgi:hypothetical membrane protein